MRMRSTVPAPRPYAPLCSGIGQGMPSARLTNCQFIRIDDSTVCKPQAPWQMSVAGTYIDRCAHVVSRFVKKQQASIQHHGSCKSKLHLPASCNCPPMTTTAEQCASPDAVTACSQGQVLAAWQLPIAAVCTCSAWASPIVHQLHPIVHCTTSNLAHCSP